MSLRTVSMTMTSEQEAGLEHEHPDTISIKSIDFLHFFFKLHRENGPSKEKGSPNVQDF